MFLYFFAFATRIKHQQNQLRPLFLFFATTRIKHQPKQLGPMFLFLCNNKNQTSTKAIETHVFVLLQQQESNINQSN
jgi:hypothetical protein